jgi:hypothetical protein
MPDAGAGHDEEQGMPHSLVKKTNAVMARLDDRSPM